MITAYDVDALSYVQIANLDDDGYDVARPKSEPYYCKRAIWHHPALKYHAWIAPGNARLTCMQYYADSFSDSDAETLADTIEGASFKKRPLASTSPFRAGSSLQHPVASTTSASSLPSPPIGASPPPVATTSSLPLHPSQPNLSSASSLPPPIVTATSSPTAHALPDVQMEAAEEEGEEAVEEEEGEEAVEEEGKDDAVEAEVEERDEKDGMEDELEALRKQLDSERSRADSAEAAAEHERKKHKTYIATNQSKMKKKNEELAEKDKELTNARVVLANQTFVDAKGKARKHPSACIERLIQMAIDALRNKQAAAANPSAATAAAAPVFEFYDNGSWIQITDATAHAELLKLLNGTSSKVHYTIGQNSYEVVVCTHGLPPPAHDFVQQNTNPQYYTQRFIRERNKHATPRDANFDILFGAESIIELPQQLVDELLVDHDFNVDQAYENSCLLAELAEAYSSLASGFKFVKRGKGKKGVDTTKSEKWTKPPCLWQWLNIAKGRGYTRCRVVMHGGDRDTYDGIRNDPVGFDLQYSGQQGEAHGKGFYFGLSDHVTVGYNRKGANPYKDGTHVAALLLTNEKVGWSHHGRHGNHGGMTLIEDPEYAKMYKTFHLSGPVSGVDNCVVLHECTLALPLGLAEAI